MEPSSSFIPPRLEETTFYHIRANFPPGAMAFFFTLLVCASHFAKDQWKRKNLWHCFSSGKCSDFEALNGIPSPFPAFKGSQLVRRCGPKLDLVIRVKR